MTPPGVHPGQEDDLDPAESLRLIEQQRARTHDALAPDERLLFGAWGVAWFVGFGLLWLAVPGEDGPLLALPGVVVGATFALLLLLAGTVTAVHSIRVGRGLSGASNRTGAMYGWGWFLGFAMLPCIVLSAERMGAPPDVTALLWPALSGLITGLLYVGGGAAWDDPLQFAIGAWIIVTTGVGALLGLPELYLALCLAGGGGFLTAAGWFALRRSRGRCPVRP